ncbi:MAG TPA: hypothetical protein PKO06_24175 [Candidatus Ozemobacteraceae bacterium]|nr:hypothetical protein [Candidatus Ozemobacteraceae bacterium]
MSNPVINIKYMLHDSDNPCDIGRCLDDLHAYLSVQPCMADFARLNDFFGIDNSYEFEQLLSDLFQYCDAHGIEVD